MSVSDVKRLKSVEVENALLDKFSGDKELLIDGYKNALFKSINDLTTSVRSALVNDI